MKHVPIFIVVLCTLTAAIQPAMAAEEENDSPPPCSDPHCRDFDFWVGEWTLTWPGGQMGTPEGETGSATNVIHPILGGCVIAENFVAEEMKFSGKSWSVYDPNKKIWKQTWVDNSGGYLLFTGGIEEGKMILRTEPYDRNGTTVISRMVFANISEGSLDWHWQRSSDGGATWNEIWTITYEKRM